MFSSSSTTILSESPLVFDEKYEEKFDNVIVELSYMSRENARESKSSKGLASAILPLSKIFLHDI